MRKYTYHFFKNSDFIKYYLLGAAISDGNVHKIRKILSFDSKDRGWLVDIGKCFAKNMRITHIKKKNTYRLTVSNRDTVTWFIEHGCISNKSLKVDFPQVPKKYLADFIRGIIDGDGSLGMYKSVNQCYICGSSTRFMTKLKAKMTAIGFDCSIVSWFPTQTIVCGRKIKPANKHHRVYFRASTVKKFLAWVYYPTHAISLRRKHIIAKKIINRKPILLIGERNGTSKLTERIVIAIRKAVKSGVVQVRLAEKYNISTATISSIVLGKSWRYLLA